MNPFEGMKMPARVIVKADIVIGKGKVLKNRRGQDIKFEGILNDDIEIAVRDGKIIWTNVINGDENGDAG